MADADPCAARMPARTGWDTARRPVRMAERLARQIVDDVLDRGLQPGELLGSEAQLCADYGVARATLREALRLLEQHGLVVPKRGPGGGLLLGEATSHAFAGAAKLHLQARGVTHHELRAARQAIEPLLARAAAEAADRSRIGELVAVVEEARALGPDEHEAFVANLYRFHAVVARLSGNAVLDLVGTIVQEVHEAHPIVATPPERRASTLAVHEGIAAAIVHGDGAAAERLMRDHVADVARAYPEQGRDERFRWA